VASTFAECVVSKLDRSTGVRVAVALMTGMSAVLLCDGAGLAQQYPEPEQSPVIITAPPPPGGSLVPQRHEEVRVEPRRVRLLFQSASEGISFHLKLGTLYTEMVGAPASYGIGYRSGYQLFSSEEAADEYTPICEAPCVATLPVGEHRFALSLQGSELVDVTSPVRIRTESVLYGSYVDNSRARRIGVWVMSLGMVAGSILMLAGADYEVFDHSNPKLFWSGFGLFFVSLGIGVPFTIRKDEARLDVHPLNRWRPQ